MPRPKAQVMEDVLEPHEKLFKKKLLDSVRSLPFFALVKVAVILNGDRFRFRVYDCSPEYENTIPLSAIDEDPNKLNKLVDAEVYSLAEWWHALR